MGNVTLPTPVFVAGAVLCVLAGSLAGALLGPDTPPRTTATVVSYHGKTAELCLTGESVKDLDGVDEDGELCGTWSHPRGGATPTRGDRFRFVTIERSHQSGAAPSRVVIFGTVVE